MSNRRLMVTILPSCVLLIIGIAFLIGTLNINDPGLQNDPGPKLAPLAGGAGLVFCSLILLFQDIKKSSMRKSNEPEEPSKKNVRNTLFLTLCIIGYCIFLYLLGFLIATPFLIFFSMGFISADTPKIVPRIIFSIATTGIIFLVFEAFLHVMLPSGILF